MLTGTGETKRVGSRGPDSTELPVQQERQLNKHLQYGTIILMIEGSSGCYGSLLLWHLAQPRGWHIGKKVPRLKHLCEERKTEWKSAGEGGRRGRDEEETPEGERSCS